MKKKDFLYDYTISSLIEMLMKKYKANDEWAFQIVANSDTYRELLNDKDFLNEGNLFIYERLITELNSKGVA